MWRAALVVSRVTTCRDTNIRRMVATAHEAGDAGADLVVFPEAAPTGLINNDDPVHDLALGEPVPGPTTELLAGVAASRGLYLAFGILERAGDRLYDSAVLLGPDGRVVFRYRRITPGWHGRNGDPRVYAHGARVHAAQTALGRIALLICGDLFDDDVLSEMCALKPDLLLVLMSRSFEDCSHDQHRWEAEELPYYLRRVARAGVTTLLVNSVAGEDCGGDFGGAMAVSGAGELIASFPLGKAGVLLVDLDQSARVGPRE